MQLIEPFYLCILLHITPHQNSFLHEDNMFKIKNICNQLKSDGIHVLEILTDGDPNYNNENETIFKIYETMNALKGFEDAFSTYSNHFLRKFFGDLLHILKLAQNRILTTLATIRVDSLDYSFIAAVIRPIFKLDPPFTDVSKNSKMRDCYNKNYSQWKTSKNLLMLNILV